ncbi:hypothetical protein GCM10009624_24090 [Gordonia sinesedis]
MRRVWLALPAFLGVACITAAIAIPGYLAPQLRAVPLDLDIVTDATTVAEDGSPGDRFPAVILDRCSINQPRARTLQAQLTQQRRTVVVEPSDRRQATLQSAQSVRIDRTRDANGRETEPAMGSGADGRKCDDGLLTASIDRVSVNRKTSVPNGTVSSLQLDAAPEGVDVKDVSVPLPNRRGFEYKFGFNVKKRDYLFFDQETRQDLPAKFTAEKTIDGVTTYEFVTEVPETDLSGLPNAQNEAVLGTMLTKSARWWGIQGRGIRPNDQVTLHRYASGTRHVWVEPKSGTIVDSRDSMNQFFRSPDQSEDTPAPVRNFRLDALRATYKWSDKSVTSQANRAKDLASNQRLVGFWIPLILGIIGALLVLAWLFLLWRGRRARSGDRDPDDKRRDVSDEDGLLEPDDRRVDDDRTEVLPGTPRHAAASTEDTERFGTGGSGSAGAGAAGAGAAAGAAGLTGAAGAAASVGARDGSTDSASDDDSYLWDRPTQRIPRVEDSPQHADDVAARDFRPLQDETATDDERGDSSRADTESFGTRDDSSYRYRRPDTSGE